MSQRTIFINGLVILCVVLFAARMWLINSADENKTTNDQVVQNAESTATVRTIEIAANKGGWQAVGKGPMAITAKGTVDLGGLKTVPNDEKKPGDDKALVPRLPYGTLLGKIGENGEPFKIGVTARIGMKDTVYLAINDDNYNDNSGFYSIVIDTSQK